MGIKICTYPVWIGLATGLTLSEVSVAGLLGIRESSSYSLGIGIGVCCCYGEIRKTSVILWSRDNIMIMNLY